MEITLTIPLTTLTCPRCDTVAPLSAKSLVRVALEKEGVATDSAGGRWRVMTDYPEGWTPISGKLFCGSCSKMWSGIASSFVQGYAVGDLPATHTPPPPPRAANISSTPVRATPSINTPTRVTPSPVVTRTNPAVASMVSASIKRTIPIATPAAQT